MRPNKRTLMVLLANLLAVAILAASASFVMLRGRPAEAEGRPVEPDSIAMTRRLESYQYERENANTLLISATFSREAYLVKDAARVLANADLFLEIPQFGIAGSMTPLAPGIYGFTTTEQIRLHSSLPLTDSRDWIIEDLLIEVDGRDTTSPVQTQDRFTALAFERVDLVGAHLGVFENPKSYTISTQKHITFRVITADGTPAANATFDVELPERDYRQTLTTDADGWVELDQVEEVHLSVRGGELVGVDGPVVIYIPSDPDELYWWEEPTPRCEMEFRTLQDRLATQPGFTAQFGFEVINRGNRQDDYHMTVTGVPEDWLEVEYGGEVRGLYPYFGQTVYINVTPERSPETKKSTWTLTATVTSSCDEQTISAGLKVQEFHDPVLNLFDPDLEAASVIAADVQRQALRVSQRSMLDLIVQAAGTLPEDAAYDVAKVGGTVNRELPIIQGLSVRLPAGRLFELSNLPWVGRVDQNRTVRALLNVNVPFLGAPALWDLGYDGTGVTVAVIDTGVDYTHPALRDHVLLGPDFAEGDDDPMDVYGHGTHVSGIIASRDPYYRGVAPGATIMAVRVLDDEGYGSLDSVIAGVDWAVRHGADVINLSLGSSPSGGLDPLSRAVDNAVKSGVLVTVSAGNSGPDYNTIGSPGDARLPVTVGAAYIDKTLVPWSSRGPTLDGRTKPDLIAPGALIFSSVPGGGFEGWSGTSMSSPMVAGLGALLIQATGAEPRLIKAGLMATAYDSGDGPNNSGAGYPMPSAALAYIQERQTLVQKEAYPGERVTFDFDLTNNGNVADRFRLTHWFGNNEVRFQAQPTLPRTAVRSTLPAGTVAPGETVTAQVEVSVPADWVGTEDAVYLLYLSATSRANRFAADVEQAALKVKVTGSAMAGYAGQVTGDLQDSTRFMGLSLPARHELLLFEEELENAAGEAAGQLNAESLANARAKAQQLQRQIQQLRQEQAIPVTEAQRLDRQVNALLDLLRRAEQKLDVK